MSSPMFDFDFKVSGSRAIERVDGQEFMAMPSKAWPVGPNESLVRVQRSERTLRLSMLDAHVLGLCGNWGTIRQHVDHAQQQFDQQVSRAMLTSSVQRLVDNGLLCSKSDWLAKYGQGAKAELRGALDVLCIRTCDRPEALVNLLTSLLSSPAVKSLRHCLLLDDSRNPDSIEANRHLAERYRERAGFSLTHVSPDDRVHWLAEIADGCGVNADSLEWFLTGNADDQHPGYGGNINLALLLTAGRRIALMDDDLEFTLFAHHGHRQSMRLMQARRPRLGLTDPDRHIGEQFEKLNIDPLAEHGRYIGAALGELILSSERDAQEMLEELTPAMMADLNEDSRVRICNHGTLGDPGTRRPDWILAGHLDAFRPYVDQPERCRQMLFQRRFALASEGIQAVTKPSLMLAFTGLDNRELLLPTQPRGANEDLMLGTLVQFAHPSSIQLHLPWMMGHRLNSGIREWTEADLAQLPGFSRGGFFSDALRELSDGMARSSVSARAEVLKGWMGSLTVMTDSDIAEKVQDFSLQRRSALAQGLGAAIAQFDSPVPFRTDIQRMIDANLADDAFERHDPVNFISSIRQVATGYHRHLDGWCEAWRWCRDNDILDKVASSGE